MRHLTQKTDINRGLPRQVSHLVAIDVAFLLEQGIRGVILDLDNTLVSEDDHYLSPGGEDWIQTAKLQGLQFFILSNGKRRYRVDYWAQRLEVPAISPAHKPFPAAFRRALTAMQLSATETIVIGDSRHTDMLGALLMGCPGIRVTTLPHPPRWWERLAGRWLQTPYPHHLELWHFDATEMKRF